VDERGVPLKNVAMEYKRKYNELYNEMNTIKSQLPQMLQEAVKTAIPTQTQEPKYSKEDLIRFKNSAEDANQRTWAEIELTKISEAENRKYFDGQMQRFQEQQRFQQESQQADSMLRSKYQVCFNPDGSWNNSHPLTQQIANVYHSDPALKSHPRGILAAADIAFANYALQLQPQLAQQTKQLKRQVKNLQKQTLVEGSGQPTNVTETSTDKMYKTFAQKGDVDTLKDFVKAKFAKQIGRAYEQSR
jgi:hypothetical protein